jgi:hypothetical protein
MRAGTAVCGTPARIKASGGLQSGGSRCFAALLVAGLLKPTLPLVIAPLVTAAVTGFGSILAASAGSIILAEVRFPIDVVAAVVGIYFGIKRRDMRMLDEIVLNVAPLEWRL